MSRYDCNLSGQCIPAEPSWLGQYVSLEECQRNCTSVGDRQNLDIAFIVLSYDWDSALKLCPTDRVELIRRHFGIRVSQEIASSVLYYLSLERIPELLALNIPELTEYVTNQLDQVDKFILDLIKIARPTLYHPDYRKYIASVLEYSKLYYADEYKIISIVNELSWKMEVDIGTARYHQLVDVVRTWLPALKEMVDE